MEMQESLKHTVWDCKYHVVWIPKYRKKAVYGELRRELGEVFRELAKQKESKIEEGHLLPDLYARDVIDTAEIFSSSDGRVHKGEKCDTYNSRKRKIAGLTS